MVTIISLNPTRSARACSICQAGDPIYDALGASAQPAGSFSAYFEVRGWEKSSGLLPGEDPDGTEFNKGRRLDLFLSWTPVDRLTFTVDLPWAFNEITEEEDGESETSELSGFGDMSLASTVVLWRNRNVLPSTWVEGRAFVKFPTGRSEEEVDGHTDPHLQPGTGSWDFGFAFAAAHKLDWGTLFASTSYRVNTMGSNEYEYGDVVLANAALRVPLGHAFRVPALDWFTPGLQLNFRWAGFDEFEHQRYEHSGGGILYLTPELLIRLPWFKGKTGPAVRGAVQIPLTQAWLNGRQDEDPIWSAGIQYAF